MYSKRECLEPICLPAKEKHDCMVLNTVSGLEFRSPPPLPFIIFFFSFFLPTPSSPTPICPPPPSSQTLSFHRSPKSLVKEEDGDWGLPQTTVQKLLWKLDNKFLLQTGSRLFADALTWWFSASPVLWGWHRHPR